MQIAYIDLDFLLLSAQNWRKSLDNLRSITQEGNTETRRTTPYFHLPFPL